MFQRLSCGVIVSCLLKVCSLEALYRLHNLSLAGSKVCSGVSRALLQALHTVYLLPGSSLSDDLVLAIRVGVCKNCLGASEVLLDRHRRKHLTSHLTVVVLYW